MATVNYRPPSIRVSFRSRMSSGRDTRTMIVEIFLKHKLTVFLRGRRLGEIVNSYERNTNFCVSFPFPLDPIVGLSSFNLGPFRAQVFMRMPGLAPSVATELSQQLFQYAQRVSIARHYDHGVMVVMALVEIEEPEIRDVSYTESSLDDDDDDDDEEEEEEEEVLNPPRGLSRGEINGLKQEGFKKSGAEDETCCSICLEEFSAGVTVTPLPCSHTFHHSCIAAWLEKQATCPLCRSHITQP